MAAAGTDRGREAFKRAVKGGQPTFGLFLDSASPLVAEQVAAFGYDYVLVDAQHSPVDHTQLAAMLTAISAAGCPSLVRVGGPHDRAGIQQALDLGAYGIMVPTVKTRGDVEAAVDACYFPPLGSRSIAWPVRPQLGRDVESFINSANDEVLLLIQVETKESYNNLEQILSVPGVDVAFMGPIDLSRALGLPQKHGFPQCFDSDDFKECLRRVAEACQDHGVVAGNFALSEAKAQAMLAAGYPFLATGTDVGLLEVAARQNLAFIHKLKAGARPSGEGS
ncbi:hypothetical protein N2152v2_001343 [Parachlorella kessleri]